MPTLNQGIDILTILRNFFRENIGILIPATAIPFKTGNPNNAFQEIDNF
jgi:hypothetical protein